MRTSRHWRTVLAVSVLAVIQPVSAYAQAPQPATAAAIRADIEQLKTDFSARLAELERRLSAMDGGAPAPEAAAVPEAPAVPTAAVPPGAEGAGGPTGTLPNYGGLASASKIFNPDIAVIGNFLGAAGTNEVSPRPSLQLAESEMSLQAVVDPYARADFFLAFGDEGAEVEEGVITFTSLPGGLLTRVGKMRTAFGKVNPLHSHVLPWTDRPLVLQHLLGGEEGLSDAGISVARLIPNPWIFLEATGAVSRGNSGDVFHASTRSDLGYLARLRGYHDLTESTNLDVGASYLYGKTALGFDAIAPESLSLVVDPSQYSTDLIGIDATLRWKPLQRSIYRSFVGRAEAVWSQREQLDGRQDASGYYVSGDYQFGRRWYAGLRFDRSGRADAANLHDQGGSVLLTYWPSEFSQVRGQLRRTKYAEGETANEFLFQFQFAIGAHGAHPF